VKSSRLLFLVTLIFIQSTEFALAKDVGGQTAYGYIILPSKKDRWYEFKSDLNFVTVIWSMAREGSGDYCASGPLTADNRRMLEKRNIHTLWMSDNADETLLSEKHLFRSLNQVGLSTSSCNERCLDVLAQDYPKIEALSVSQTQLLSDAGISSLTKFRHLKDLELHCKVATPALIPDCLPKALESLQIDDGWTLPELPKLRNLVINTCQLDEQFLEKMNADGLEDIRLFNVKLSKGSLNGVRRFKHLRELYTFHCDVDEETRQYLRTFPYLRVQIQD
jgi:hypothetical protein